MSLQRLLLSVLACTLLAHPAAAGIQDEEGVYPANACVSEKLKEAAVDCRRVMRAWAGYERDGDKVDRQALIQKGRDRLAETWAATEAQAVADGATCDEASARSRAVARVLERGGRSLAKALNEGLDLTDDTDARCGARMLRAVGRTCDALLDAHGDHLVERNEGDRDGEDLAAAEQRAWDAFQTRWDDLEEEGCAAGLDAESAGERLETLVDDARMAGTTWNSPVGQWVQIDPPEEVVYKGETLNPICSTGTPYLFFARKGTVNKLVVYFQGGGACWNRLTCGGVPGLIGPVFKQFATPGDNPALSPGGLNDPDNPLNPFRNWHGVFVSYCTGDVHWGDAVVEHVLDTLRTTTNHKGFVNAQVVEKWTREHFVHPEQVFVTGSSAGAYGAIVNSLTLQQYVYPSSDFAVLGDAGNGVITDEFLVNDLSKWGIEDNLPEFIPALNVPLTELDAADLWVESALHFPRGRFATYTTAFDGGTGGQSGFYNIMRQPNVLFWTFWWEASCDWNEAMRALNLDAAARAENFRYYIGSGSAHTMFGRDRVYDGTTGNVPTIVNWLNGMLEGNADWVNVECDDCSTILEGDPVPNEDPLPPPFTEDGRIICEDDQEEPL